MKGIILVGGLGTRLDPMTRVINKHLLPVGPFPMVYYPLHSLVDAGIRDIMIVTGGNNPGEFLELLHDGSEFGLDHLYFTYQQQPLGIADALRKTAHFVGSDRCVVILGDNILGRPFQEIIVHKLSVEKVHCFVEFSVLFSEAVDFNLKVQ